METLFEMSPYVTVIVPLIVGAVELAKGVGLQGRYAPLASVTLGMVFVAMTNVSWQAALIQGLIAGLTASGIYSGTKAVGAPEKPQFE